MASDGERPRAHGIKLGQRRGAGATDRRELDGWDCSGNDYNVALGGGGASAHGAGQRHPIVRAVAATTPCSRAKAAKTGQLWPARRGNARACTKRTNTAVTRPRGTVTARTRRTLPRTCRARILKLSPQLNLTPKLKRSSLHSRQYIRLPNRASTLHHS